MHSRCVLLPSETRASRAHNLLSLSSPFAPTTSRCSSTTPPTSPPFITPTTPPTTPPPSQQRPSTRHSSRGGDERTCTLTTPGMMQELLRQQRAKVSPARHRGAACHDGAHHLQRRYAANSYSRDPSPHHCRHLMSRDGSPHQARLYYSVPARRPPSHRATLPSKRASFAFTTEAQPACGSSIITMGGHRSAPMYRPGSSRRNRESREQDGPSPALRERAGRLVSSRGNCSRGCVCVSSSERTRSPYQVRPPSRHATPSPAAHRRTVSEEDEESRRDLLELGEAREALNKVEASLQRMRSKPSLVAPGSLLPTYSVLSPPDPALVAREIAALGGVTPTSAPCGRRMPPLGGSASPSELGTLEKMLTTRAAKVEAEAQAIHAELSKVRLEAEVERARAVIANAKAVHPWTRLERTESAAVVNATAAAAEAEKAALAASAARAELGRAELTPWVEEARVELEHDRNELTQARSGGAASAIG